MPACVCAGLGTRSVIQAVAGRWVPQVCEKQKKPGRVKAFPFGEEVKGFIEKHEVIYVVEQNRDAQLKTLLMLDIEANPDKLVSLLHYNGMPLNAGFVVESVLKEMAKACAA